MVLYDILLIVLNLTFQYLCYFATNGALFAYPIANRIIGVEVLRFVLRFFNEVALQIELFKIVLDFIIITIVVYFLAFCPGSVVIVRVSVTIVYCRVFERKSRVLYYF